QRILDAAEQLFSERGIRATSLRAITGAAGMNPAAIHYHYGSKEALVLAVARRRIDPVNSHRLQTLGKLEAEAHGAAVQLEDLVEAFLAPQLFSVSARFAAIVHNESPEIVGQIVPELFGEVHDRFMAALTLTLPEYSPLVLETRFRFAVGVMLHVLLGFAGIPIGEAEFQPPSPGDEAMLQQMVTFLAAGLRAPEETRR
ncbi:MAG: TetR/AcrR family transcriptional regulator, partial [bacterium]|nr:TetR/AcrR family transcriptional regulator [bacterium]